MMRVWDAKIWLQISETLWATSSFALQVLTVPFCRLQCLSNLKLNFDILNIDQGANLLNVVYNKLSMM